MSNSNSSYPLNELEFRMHSTVEASAIKQSIVENTDDVDTDSKTLSCYSIEEPVIGTDVLNDKYLYIVADKVFDSFSKTDAIKTFFENEDATGGGEIVDWELSKTSKPWDHHWQIDIKYRLLKKFNSLFESI